MSSIITAGQPTKDYLVTVEFAKHIAMMARTKVGHDYRNYLIACEHKLIDVQNKQLKIQSEKLKGARTLHEHSVSALTGVRDNKIISMILARLVLLGYIVNVPKLRIRNKYRVTELGQDSGFSNCEKSTVRAGGEIAQKIIADIFNDILTVK
jgi:hypothetical protein